MPYNMRNKNVAEFSNIPVIVQKRTKYKKDTLKRFYTIQFIIFISSRPIKNITWRCTLPCQRYETHQPPPIHKLQGSWSSLCRTTHRRVHSSPSQLITNELNQRCLFLSQLIAIHHQHPWWTILNTPNGIVPSWASFWHGFVITP